MPTLRGQMGLGLRAWGRMGLMMRMRSRGVVGGPAAGPAVIAHRGASGERPENTVAAFARAREVGADWVELDVRRTADHQTAVHHDAALADGRLIAACHRGDIPASVPTLIEALRACAGMGVNIEIKNLPFEPDYDDSYWLAAAVVDALAAPDLVQMPVLVSSFDPATLRALRHHDGAPPTALLTFAPIELDEVIAQCRADGHSAWHPYDATVDRIAVQRAHEAELAVNVWTVDDPVRIAELAAFGVDGICTNRPDVALTVLQGAA